MTSGAVRRLAAAVLARALLDWEQGAEVEWRSGLLPFWLGVVGLTPSAIRRALRERPDAVRSALLAMRQERHGGRDADKACVLRPAVEGKAA